MEFKKILISGIIVCRMYLVNVEGDLGIYLFVCIFLPHFII
jgi:hypothetical protein